MTEGMRTYFTGLLPYSYESLSRPLEGRGWAIGLLPKLKGYQRDCFVSCSEEIVIYAKSLERAKTVLSLILDALAVLSGDLPERDQPSVIPADKAEREKLTLDNTLNPYNSWSTSGFLLSCLIARRASLNNKFVYAIALCRQSMALHCNYEMDLDPALFPYQHRSLWPRDHVRFAYAIVTAYAVLEKLGLDLKGECFEKGKWIVSRRQDLEKRLSDAGLNVSEPVSWYLRGGKSKLEKKRPPSVLGKSSWCKGKIRDCEVSLPDAIGDLRWLRSGVAAHSASRLISRLSVHDVANAQKLARMAILASMGFDRSTVDKLYQKFELS